MAETMHADPEALTQLGRQTLNAVDATSDAIVAMLAAARLTASDFGDTTAAAAVLSAACEATEAADCAVGTIAEVLELDADNLIQTAVAYREIDLDEAARFRATGPRAF